MSNIHEATKRLVSLNLRKYLAFHLRASTREDLQRIVARNAQRAA